MMELQKLIDGLKAHKNGAASYESVDEAIRVFEAMRDVDGEKVCKGLGCCILRDPDDHRRCGECPYNPHSISNEPCTNGLMANALALIRQQQERIAELEAELGQRDYNAAVEMQQYDFSGWTTEMIVAKIREIERKKEIAYKEYIDLVASFNSQLRALYNPLSNENHFNCDEAPKEESQV